jgi:hypothetical protein
MHNYYTNYHTDTCFDTTYFVILRQLVIGTFPVTPVFKIPGHHDSSINILTVYAATTLTVYTATTLTVYAATTLTVYTATTLTVYTATTLTVCLRIVAKKWF